MGEGDGTAPFPVGTIAIYSCDSGYRLEGESVRLCEQNGTVVNWNGTAACCIRECVVLS